MSGYDDYRGEMQGTAISDQEIERFFTGEVSNGLATLSPLVDMLRDFDRPPSDAAVERFAAEASKLALESRTAQAPITVRRGRALRLTPQLAGAALAAVLVIGGAGTAAAADGSAPGDALYGLDRALERIGIWDGRIEERLDEASSLFVEGQTRLALEHATEALAEDGEGSELALASLEDALDELPGPQDPEDATGTTEKVGALLTYLQENVGKGVGADGREFGLGVAELARGLTGEDEQSAPVTTPSLPTTPDNDSSSGNGDGPASGNGNGATPPGQGNQGTNPGQGNGNQGTNPGQGNGTQGTNPGQGNGNQGTNPGQGNGNQGTNPGPGNRSGDVGTNPEQGSGDETGETPEDGDPDPPGQGDGSENQGTSPGQVNGSGNQGNGPPPGSPSETAPGRGNQP